MVKCFTRINTIKYFTHCGRQFVTVDNRTHNFDTFAEAWQYIFYLRLLRAPTTPVRTGAAPLHPVRRF